MKLDEAKAHAKAKIKQGRVSKDTLALKAMLEALDEVVFDDELLKRIRNLCHPDRHGQSMMSLNVTKALMEIKK